MKKIGIISDTHGLLRPEILEILKDCDCIIHAGDVNKPEILDTLRMMGSIYVVRGNNDKDWAEGIAKTLHCRNYNFQDVQKQSALPPDKHGSHHRDMLSQSHDSVSRFL